MKIAEQLEFVGDFSSNEFCEWVRHRADRLGLVGWVRAISQQKMEVAVCGEPELIDAMEVACSLGPFSSTVEEINRTPYVGPDDVEKCEEFNIRAAC
ncbi:MAG: acylphosphatase [Hyphomicrobiales bacterium]